PGGCTQPGARGAQSRDRQRHRGFPSAESEGGLSGGAPHAKTPYDFLTAPLVRSGRVWPINRLVRPNKGVAHARPERTPRRRLELGVPVVRSGASRARGLTL